MLLKIPKSILNSFRQGHPGDFEALAPIFQSIGPSNSLAIINADELDRNKNNISTAAYDKIYKEALTLREDRFSSYYFQLNEILQLPRSRATCVLEVGPGHGILGSLLRNFGFKLDTLDLTYNSKPTLVGDVRNIPAKDNSYDLVCAFEVLEHLPFDQFKKAISEMARCSKNFVFISLPFANSSVTLQVRLRLHPNIVNRFSFNKIFSWILPLKPKDIDQDQLVGRSDLHNPHYWEVNRKSFPKERILSDLHSHGLNVIKDFHNPRFPYHYFILCEKIPV